MRVIAWSDARRLGMLRYFTGVPCKHGHVAERFVGNSECVECMNARYRNGGKERERQRREGAKLRKRTARIRRR